MAKYLKPPEVVAIRKQHRAGYTIRDIARAYERSESTISDIVHGRTYTRVVEVEGCPPLPSNGRNSEGRKRRVKPRVPAG